MSAFNTNVLLPAIIDVVKCTNATSLIIVMNLPPSARLSSRQSVGGGTCSIEPGVYRESVIVGGGTGGAGDHDDIHGGDRSHDHLLLDGASVELVGTAEGVVLSGLDQLRGYDACNRTRICISLVCHAQSTAIMHLTTPRPLRVR